MARALGILAPSGRDALVIQNLLAKADIAGHIAANVEELTSAVQARRTGSVIIAEEALGPNELAALEAILDSQPPWSDLPIILLTKHAGRILHQQEIADRLGNVTILERPLSPVTLISAARAALRARARQHETESHIAELAARERELTEQRALLQLGEARLLEANEKLGQRFAEALAEKRVLADIVEATDAFVQVADLNYRWLAVNKAAADEFERIYGIRPAIGASMLDAIAHMPDHRRSVQAVWGRALSGEEFTEIGEFGDSKRERRLYEMKYNVLRDAEGNRIGAYQFVYDVTNRLREQQQLAEAQARMHELAKLETLGQLTGGVAHDFNNLLTPILGALDLLHRRHKDDPRSARLATNAIEAAQRAAILVQRLLSFARRQHLETRAVDVGELIDGMRDLIQRSIGPHIEVRLTIEPRLPTARIDPNQLELAVLNLAVNASDAMPGGGRLMIDVCCRQLAGDEVSDLAPGPYIRLAVTDTGSGMDEATMARAIEPFFTTKGLGKGTGLGLSMVHGLAAQSGGVLKLTSVAGKGTTAAIWLPVSGDRPDQPVLSAPPAPLSVRPTVILLVDDEPLVRKATADMLRDLGHDVIEASSAIAALETLRERQDIEMLISDYLMPGMRGDELIGEARLARPRLKVLLITGYATLTGGDESLARLPKPFRAADLAREIERQFDDTLIDLSAHRDRSR